ncbi:MAG: tRNA (N(6)-L-threonylcarbamoyladenosine(37)-C(2))-methylthiotransferase MtaB [Oscillospiraceae bacterium]|jgi:threonylcarbamoyladenosine tRNA methylthiotransferase MtaB|nr:tRNA (N(6)-L-threonylcarbamoyladenosine(37)-C(2))-methylthiotransferase MtaB [Oscillospiraceae bacterium]
MKFTCYTQGCKVNQYESQAMEQRLLALGHTLGAPDEPCDAYIINTCTVTAAADRKNRTLIRRIRKENPQAVIGVCGCYAQVNTQAVRALGVDVISGSGGQEEFVRLLVQATQSKLQEALVHVDNAAERRQFEMLPAGGLAARTRAMLKVQDGCNNFCSYCIIPYARGRVRSLPLLQALEQARAVAENGYKELVLTGIEVASWGQDFKDGSSFADLVCAVCDAVPALRVRLGSLEPRIVDEAFCLRLKALPNLCGQFHLSLQSGCDGVLKRMNRKYDTARYLQSVALLREHFPDCAVTTDLIVGFPGETEAEFAQSLAFAETCRFAAIHVFPYSRRAGTPAANMQQQLSKAEKSARSARAGDCAERLAKRFQDALIGSRQEVLFEQGAQGLFSGHAKNGVMVYAEGDALENQVRLVRIEAPYGDGVFGQIL